MVTLEGFLSHGDGEPPRMTAGQKDVVLRGVRAALEASCPPGVATGLIEAISAAMGAVPSSQSCFCCDLFIDGNAHCRHWKDAVPEHVRPQGCDKFQDVGAPF